MKNKFEANGSTNRLFKGKDSFIHIGEWSVRDTSERDRTLKTNIVHGCDPTGPFIHKDNNCCIFCGKKLPEKLEKKLLILRRLYK